MGAYKFDGMDEWFKKHHADYFTANVKKTIKPIERKKSAFNMQPKNIRYGEQSREPIVQSFFINNHEIALHKDGVLTCDCQGWIYKRAGVQRECRHVREIYGELKHKETPPKTIKPSIEERLALKILELMED